MTKSEASLEQAFLRLKHKLLSLSYNPLLEAFDQDNLAMLDRESQYDNFVAEKKNVILELIKNHGVDFQPELKSAYDEYSEALTWLWLKSKVKLIERIAETSVKTPDFKVTISVGDGVKQTDHVVFAELKSMSFADGNLNYKEVMDDALNAQISMDQQRKAGNRISHGVTVVSPMLKRNKEYDHPSIRYAIETLIEKIEQNIKEGQYEMGETVLMIDLKQLVIPTYLMEGGVPVTFDKQRHSLISGVQWNTAFGMLGDPIYKQADFEGSANIDGRLNRKGILIGRDWIKAIVFFEFRLSDKVPKLLGLYRSDIITKGVLAFLNEVCDFVNDDKNSEGWQNNRKLFER